MLNFKDSVKETTGMRIIDLLPKKVKRMIYRHQHSDKYKAALLMMKALRKDPDVITRGLSKDKIKAIAADHFGLNHREFDKVLDRKTRYEEKAPHKDDDSGWVEEYINEAPLGPADLAGFHSVTKELRVDILKKLIKDGTPIKMVPNKGHKKDLFTVTDKKLALDGLDQFTRDGKSFSIGTNDGKNVISSHIFKSKLFGGEMAGAGPGTKATAETESAQALWCAAITAEGKGKPFEYYTDEILSKHTNRAFTGGTSLKIMLKIPDDWKMSAYKSAQVLIKGGFINKGMTFHRDDRVMNGVYSIKKDAYRNSDLKNLNNDKWNPGDIWAVSKDYNEADIPTDTIRGLNKYMLEQYNLRNLVGISLKGIMKGDGQFKEYNKEVPAPTDDYKLAKLQVKGAKRGTFWSTKECNITTTDGMTLDLKPNKNLGTMKIEIKGKSARGGSIGYGPVEDTAVIVKLPKMRSNADIVKLAKLITSPVGKNGKHDRKTLGARRDFYNRASKYEKMTRKVFDEEIEKKDTQWVHAKMGGIEILDMINNASAIKANRAVTRMINYAGSKLEDSSVYVKVSE